MDYDAQQRGFAPTTKTHVKGLSLEKPKSGMEPTPKGADIYGRPHAGPLGKKLDPQGRF